MNGAWTRVRPILIVLVFQMTFLPAWADPPPPGGAAPAVQQRDDSDPELSSEEAEVYRQALRNLDDIPQESKDFAQQHTELLEPVLIAYTTAMEAKNNLVQEWGEEEFSKRASKEQVVVDVPFFGHAEIKPVDGDYFVRVIHPITQDAYILVDGSTVNRDSKHLRQIVARQHIDAGKNRTDLKYGRNLILVWMDHFESTRVDDLPKPSPVNAQYWKEYVLATVKKPSRGDVKVGTIFGVSQMGVGFISSAIIELTKGGSFDFTTPFVSLAFGTTIGIGSSTYRNWTNRPSRDVIKSGASKNAKGWGEWTQAVALPWVSRTIKGSAVSTAFAITVTMAKAMTDPSVATISFFPLIWAKGKEVALNVAINNATKEDWRRIVIQLDDSRENAEDIDLPLIGKVPAPAFYSQSINMIPFVVKLLDLVGITSYNLHGFAIPIGLIILKPVAEYMGLRFTEKLLVKKMNDPLYPEKKLKDLREQAEGLRYRWEHRWGYVGVLGRRLNGYVDRVMTQLSPPALYSVSDCGSAYHLIIGL